MGVRSALGFWGGLSLNQVQQIKTQHSIEQWKTVIMDQQAIGRMLSRATLSNWGIRPTEDWLMPVVERMHMHLLQMPANHADETSPGAQREGLEEHHEVLCVGVHQRRV